MKSGMLSFQTPFWGFFKEEQQQTEAEAVVYMFNNNNQQHDKLVVCKREWEEKTSVPWVGNKCSKQEDYREKVKTSMPREMSGGKKSRLIDGSGIKSLICKKKY